MRVFVLSFFATTVIAAGVGCQNNPVAAPINDAEYERQTEQYQRQLDKGDEQIKRAGRMNDKAEEQAQRLDRLLDHWEGQADRYDKILEKWEAQPAPR